MMQYVPHTQAFWFQGRDPYGDWLISRRLGSGSFGAVYKVEYGSKIPSPSSSPCAMWRVMT